MNAPRLGSLSRDASGDSVSHAGSRGLGPVTGGSTTRSYLMKRMNATASVEWARPSLFRPICARGPVSIAIAIAAGAGFDGRWRMEVAPILPAAACQVASMWMLNRAVAVAERSAAAGWALSSAMVLGAPETTTVAAARGVTRNRTGRVRCAVRVDDVRRVRPEPSLGYPGGTQPHPPKQRPPLRRPK